MKLARPSRLDWAIICCSVVLARCWITGDSTLMTIAGMLVLALAGIADRLNRIEQRLQTREGGNSAIIQRSKEPSSN
jgi:hypothetical protein